MKFVPLSNSDRYAIVDDEDYEAAAAFRWILAEPKKGHFYAKKSTGGAMHMHRFIAGRAGIEGESIDHINHAGLDNRRANLRGCTAMENCWNARRKTGSSGHPNVKKSGKGWVVSINHARKHHYFGYFRELEQAKEVAKAALIQLRGEFAPVDERGELKQHPSQETA